MEHFYQNIKGFFDFQDIYSEAVRNAENGSHFVEVGSFLGKSTAFMAVEIINSGKQITFECIDTFTGDDGTLKKMPEYKDFYEQFLKNMEPVRDFVIPHKTTSVEASKTYRDRSLDFVFIDASHDYESVRDDIRHWKPKVKGVLAGHDYRINCPGVWRAVNEAFPNVKKRKNSWYISL